MKIWFNRFRLLVLGLLVIGTNMATRAASEDSGDAITITPADFKKSPDKLMQNLARLESLASVSRSTAEYALNFRDFQSDLGKANPPLSQWSDADQNRVKKLPEPTAAAWQALRSEEEQTQARKQQQIMQAQEDSEARARARREQDRLQTEQDRLDREAELRTERNNAINYNNYAYPYYGGYWWNSGHGHHRPNRPFGVEGNRYYGTKPLIPNNYTPGPPRQ